MQSVLFVCIANAGRSQMAAAFTQKYGEGRIIVKSGGTHPEEHVHNVVVEAMREKGIDISQNRPRRITASELYDTDHVIVMGCRAEEFCPAPLLDRVIDWNLDDPKDQPIEKVREIRDEIEEKAIQLIETLTKHSNKRCPRLNPISGN